MRINRMKEIDSESDIHSARLLTAALGLEVRAENLLKLLKKCFYKASLLLKKNIFHMKRELGDIIWYWATACMALNLDPYEVISENKSKLEARYGKGFKVEKSEHRKKR